MTRKNFLKSLSAGSLMLAGCKKPSGNGAASDNSMRVKVGFMGLTCEAPLFMAFEHGYYAAEGLQVEMVKCEWTQFKDVLALGSIHVGQQPVVMFLKPIEQGMDVKMTGGVHRGCLRVQTFKESNIKVVEDLRGKRIGVPGMGTPPFIFANRVLGRNKVDPRTEIQWRVFPSGELGLAMQKGEVDAVATSEPVGSLLMAAGNIHNVADLGVDQPYADEYCCSIMLNGKFADTNQKACGAVTRAILKGAKWVEKNARAAAKLSIEKGYLASNPELNAQALGALRFIPSVSGGKDAIRTAAQDMIGIGMLNANTDIAELTRRIYVEPPGLTDEWLNSVEVEKVADGQILPDQWDRVAFELATKGAPKFAETCCSARSRIVN